MKIRRILVLIERDYPLFFISVALIGGQAGAYFLRPSIDLWPLPITLLGLRLLLKGLLGRCYLFAWFGFTQCLVLNTFLCVNSLWEPSIVQKKAWYIQGVVVDEIRYPRPGEIKLGILALTKKGEKGDNSEKTKKLWCRSALLPWLNSRSLRVGYEFFALIRVKGLTGLPVWYQDYLHSRGYEGTCYLELVSVSSRKEEMLSGFRRRLRDYIYKRMGRSENIGLLLAMSLGYRDQIRVQTEDAFKRTGLMHVLVLSGFQLTIVFGTVAWIVKSLLGRFGKVRDTINLHGFSTVAGLGGVILLLLVAGLEHSSTRAAISLLLVSLSTFWERRVHLGNTIISSLFLLSIFWPGCIYDIGVQLTYAALIGILISVTERKNWFCFFSVSLWVSVCTSIVVIFKLQAISIGGFIFNPFFAGLFSFLGVQAGILSLLLFLCGADNQGVLSSFVSELIGKLKFAVLRLAECEWVYFDFNAGKATNMFLVNLLLSGLIMLAILQVISTFKKYLNQYGR
jgi:hypothetical protein